LRTRFGLLRMPHYFTHGILRQIGSGTRPTVAVVCSHDRAASDSVVNTSDYFATLAAIAVLAYAGETMGLGHGGVCLVGGSHITALAPLSMRYGAPSAAMVAAGPAFNLAAAAVCAALLRRCAGWNESRLRSGVGPVHVRGSVFLAKRKRK